jgi:hypothetical protein
MGHLIEFPSAFPWSCRAGVDGFADDFAVGGEALPADGAMPFFGVFAHQNAPTASSWSTKGFTYVECWPTIIE